MKVVRAKVEDVIIMNIRGKGFVPVLVKDLNSIGVEGIPQNMLNPKLTFYPFSNIISITKKESSVNEAGG